MTVKELKNRIEKMDDDMPVVIETEQGQKFHLMTAKTRTLRAGHKNEAYCWLPVGSRILSPLELK